MTRILVTGANGFVGSSLVRNLVEAGHEVRAMMQPGTPTGGVDRIAQQTVWADLTSPSSLDEAVRGVDAVAHLAALLGDYGPADTYMRVNVDGTKALLDRAVAAGVRRLLLMSSLAVHRYRGHPQGDEDTVADNDRMPYAVSKRRAEALLREAQAAGQIETVVVRPGVFLYGPNDVRHFVPLARSIERGWIPLLDGGRARMCTSYVDNLTEGVRLCLETPAAAGRTYVLSDDATPTWRELFGRIADELGTRPPRVDVPSRVALGLARLLERAVPLFGRQRDPGLTEYRVRLVSSDIVFSSGRARRELGWSPAIDLGEGLRRSVAWYRAHQKGGAASRAAAKRT